MTKIRQAGGEVKRKRGQFFYNSKCHGCGKAPADDNNFNVSGWQLIPSTSGKSTSGGAPDAAGAYALQYAKKIYERAGNYAHHFW
jgi:hypothetical protein